MLLRFVFRRIFARHFKSYFKSQSGWKKWTTERQNYKAAKNIVDIFWDIDHFMTSLFLKSVKFSRGISPRKFKHTSRLSDYTYEMF